MLYVYQRRIFDSVSVKYEENVSSIWCLVRCQYLNFIYIYLLLIYISTISVPIHPHQTCSHAPQRSLPPPSHIKMMRQLTHSLTLGWVLWGFLILECNRMYRDAITQHQSHTLQSVTYMTLPSITSHYDISTEFRHDLSTSCLQLHNTIGFIS